MDTAFEFDAVLVPPALVAVTWHLMACVASPATVRYVIAVWPAIFAPSFCHWRAYDEGEFVHTPFVVVSVAPLAIGPAGETAGGVVIVGTGGGAALTFVTTLLSAV